VDAGIVIASAPVTIPAGILVAFVLRRQIGSPILFRQQRLGYQERAFQLLKFRTMADVRDEAGKLLPDELRITRVGATLRKLSLDELPQLINVLRGDMALVGPRPLFVRYQPFYTERERARHLVRPGITGLAQVSGRNALRWDSRLELDVKYVESASLLLDAKIVLKTVLKIVQRKDVSVIAGESGKPLDVYRTFPRSGTLAMRPLAPEDIPARVSWMNDPSTREHMRISGEITIESTQQWFDSKTGDSSKLDFVVEDTANGGPVAMMGLRDRSLRSAESYIFVDPARRGRGYGTVAQELLLTWAFFNGGYDTVISSVSLENASSRRIHKKFGGNVVTVSPNREEVVVSRTDFIRATSSPAASV
jgi:lipopolysaccharide/colanic/teichoic acid biosynthesis glycosyltransferase/RimJ/RimL family protein N-acetyltransferase